MATPGQLLASGLSSIGRNIDEQDRSIKRAKATVKFLEAQGIDKSQFANATAEEVNMFGDMFLQSLPTMQRQREFEANQALLQDQLAREQGQQEALASLITGANQEVIPERRVITPQAIQDVSGLPLRQPQDLTAPFVSDADISMVQALSQPRIAPQVVINEPEETKPRLDELQESIESLQQELVPATGTADDPIPFNQFAKSVMENQANKINRKSKKNQKSTNEESELQSAQQSLFQDVDVDSLLANDQALAQNESLRQATTGVNAPTIPVETVTPAMTAIDAAGGDFMTMISQNPEMAKKFSQLDSKEKEIVTDLFGGAPLSKNQAISQQLDIFNKIADFQKTIASTEKLIQEKEKLISEAKSSNKKLTEQQTKIKLHKDSMDLAWAQMQEIESTGFEPNAKIGFISTRLPDVLKGQIAPLRNAYDSASNMWADQLIRIHSGAAVPEQELKRYLRNYVIQPGDAPEAVAVKKEMQKVVMESLDQILTQQGVDQLSADELFSQHIGKINQAASGYGAPTFPFGSEGVTVVGVRPVGQ